MIVRALIAVACIAFATSTFFFPKPWLAVHLWRLSVETADLAGDEDFVDYHLHSHEFTDEIGTIVREICSEIAHRNDDFRCNANAHSTLRTIRTLLAGYPIQTLIGPTGFPLEEEGEGKLVGYGHAYDAALTANKSVCVIGAFSLRLYTYIRLFSGASRIIYHVRVPQPDVPYRDKRGANVTLSAAEVDQQVAVESVMLEQLSGEEDVQVLSTRFTEDADIASLLASDETSWLLSVCDVVHIRDREQESMQFLATVVHAAKALRLDATQQAKAHAGTDAGVGVDADTTAAGGGDREGTDNRAALTEAFIIWERSVHLSSAHYRTYEQHKLLIRLPPLTFQEGSQRNDVTDFLMSIRWDGSVVTDNTAVYEKSYDSQGFLTRFVPHKAASVVIETGDSLTELVFGYAHTYHSPPSRPILRMFPHSIPKSALHATAVGGGGTAAEELLTVGDMDEDADSSLSSTDVASGAAVPPMSTAEAIDILTGSGILQQFEHALGSAHSYFDNFNARKISTGRADLPVVITLSNRAHNGAARGLQLALMSLGYRYVFIAPELNLHYLHAMQAYMRHVLAIDSYVGGTRSETAASTPDILQISIAPQDIQMLLPHYVAIQLEKPHNELQQRTLRHALGVWTLSAKLLDDIHQSGLSLNNARTIPATVLSDAARNSQLVEKHIKHITWSPTLREVKEPESLTHSLAPEPPDASFYLFDAIIIGASSKRQVEFLNYLYGELYGLYNQTLDFFPKDDAGNQKIIGKGMVNMLSVGKLRIAYVVGGMGEDMGSGLHGQSVFDDDRDYYVLRSKTVVNIHTDEGSSLEVHRVNYLLSLGKCVVSERSSTEPELDERYSYKGEEGLGGRSGDGGNSNNTGEVGGVVFVQSYRDILSEILNLVGPGESRRHHIESSAFRRFHQNLRRDAETPDTITLLQAVESAADAMLH